MNHQINLKKDQETIKEVRKLVNNLQFDEAMNLTRKITHNEFAVRAALIVMAAEHSHQCGTFIKVTD